MLHGKQGREKDKLAQSAMRGRLASWIVAKNLSLETSATGGILAQAGKRLAVTNGGFDLPHTGMCLFTGCPPADVLLVGLNGDASVRELKGPAGRSIRR